MLHVRKLRIGDYFVCPTTGRTEAVRRNPERRPDGRWFVRTSAHDHNFQATDEVELVLPKKGVCWVVVPDE